MKEFRKEIDSNLTKEQLIRLKEMDEKRQEMIRKNRKNHWKDSLKYRSDRNFDPGMSSPENKHDSTRPIR